MINTIANAEAGSSVRAKLNELIADYNTTTTAEAGTTITVNAAYLGAANSVLVLCSSASAVAVTLANDVPVGKVVAFRQGGTGTVTASAGSGATLQKPASANHYTEEQYDRITYQVVANSGGAAAVWGLI